MNQALYAHMNNKRKMEKKVNIKKKKVIAKPFSKQYVKKKIKKIIKD
jgi:hypothetical protein